MDEERASLDRLNRQRLRLMWELANAGGVLNDEDTRTVDAMHEHDEYTDLWGRLDELSNSEIERDGTDPILHITTHTVIENQIAAGDPKEVAGVIEGMMKRGHTRHQAIHRVGQAFMAELYYVLKDNRAFDRQSYLRRLAKLSSAPFKRKSPRRSRR